ncbi:MAG TPA: molybdopterin synthase catalytic subunit MoaE [Rhizomicrobium sp.]|nr:molybdopterin synthase catalytic subunit MoaE [Rhizomicrobium sp.]
MNTHIRIQNEDFDVNDELEALASESNNVGALASFVGLVRGDDKLTSLTLEHYPGMTEREIKSHVEDANKRWPILGVTIIHRVGRLKPGDRIVLVAVAASHRGAAFEACEFLMDYLKTRAPFWKREDRGGQSAWIEARASDEKAADRWK